jgi:F0F1-type ATP synthase membrane subunit b/b'
MLSLLTGFGSSALGFFSNPKRLLYLGLSIILFLALWQGTKFVNNALDNAALVESQRIELQLKDAEIETQQALRAQAERAAAVSEAARKEAEQRADEIRQIRDAILESGDERDGAIAPVLEDTLRALRQRN